ncbi:MAG: 3'-5' exonuclease [Ellagibacter isourolithinifaciens]|uniref:3'-5' exonuclease n=1 Tax=Ellagibacter isourolithinifaciens TaxID=2137581 RepID=UPI002E76C09C|nr:3'-5' exonuclease [Ellagibacter isourolithinifaciens]MEE1455058.1 3'-5' exonuclease [Ellagibacter isourolithinifaciens]
MSRYEQNIVVDLEFTPVDKGAKTRKFKYEIIQIGAVRVSSDGEIKDSFSSFVKPEYTKSIAYAVQELTGIRMCNLTSEDTLEQILEKFREWVGSKPTRFVAWSETDLKQLNAETEKKNIPFHEKGERWLDLQKVYPRFMEVGNGRQIALCAAANWCGIEPSKEDLHGALYDARVTAELLKNLLTKEFLEQKNCIASVMSDASRKKETSYTIGDKFSSLLQLKTKLEIAGA